MNIFYASPEHKRRWLMALLQMGQIHAGKLDPEYGAALYLLTSSAGTWHKAEPYADREGIRFEALLREVDFSSGSGVLIDLAANLFNDRFACSPVDVATCLDDTNFAAALTALQIRRVSLPLAELATKAEMDNLEMDIRNHEESED